MSVGIVSVRMREGVCVSVRVGVLGMSVCVHENGCVVHVCKYVCTCTCVRTHECGNGCACVCVCSEGIIYGTFWGGEGD